MTYLRSLSTVSASAGLCPAFGRRVPILFVSIGRQIAYAEGKYTSVWERPGSGANALANSEKLSHLGD
jgi:hypothetical protein